MAKKLFFLFSLTFILFGCTANNVLPPYPLESWNIDCIKKLADATLIFQNKQDILNNSSLSKNGAQEWHVSKSQWTRNNYSFYSDNSRRYLTEANLDVSINDYDKSNYKTQDLIKYTVSNSLKKINYTAKYIPLTTNKISGDEYNYEHISTIKGEITYYEYYDGKFQETINANDINIVTKIRKKTEQGIVKYDYEYKFELPLIYNGYRITFYGEGKIENLGDLSELANIYIPLTGKVVYNTEKIAEVTIKDGDIITIYDNAGNIVSD